ncbi:MAG: EamA family transporter [Solirubrobacteraceae bacterium]
MFSVILACSASLAWGSSDFLAGVGCRRVRLAVVLLVSQLFGLALLVPALVAQGTPPPAASFCALAVLAGLLNAAALAAFYRGLARGPIGLVAPIAATEALIPLAVGLFEGERPSALAMAGIVLALAGVVLAARPRREYDHEEQGVSHLPSIVLAVMAAICFGLFVVAIKGASEGGALWAVTFSRLTTVVALIAAFPLMGIVPRRPSLRWLSSARTGLANLQADMPALLSVGALDVGASAMFALAAANGALSVIGVLGSAYPVVTIALAGIFLRERLGGWQRVGTIGALTGLALIAAR